MESNPMCLALNAVKVLRLEVGNLFSTLSSGIKEEHGEDGREFIIEIQKMLNIIHQRYRELEHSVNNINIPSGPSGNILLNSSFLTQESIPDKQTLYSPLVLSHKWVDKVHKYSALAYTILNSNSLKKSHFLNSSLNKRKRPQTNGHNIPPNQVDAFITSIDRMFSDMNITLSRSFAATNVVIQVTLGRVLQAMIAFKGIMIEWVVIKGYNEPCDSPIDLMSESRYNVFRRVTDHAHTATLHFALSNSPEITVKSFVTWLHSYLSLFSATCKQCGRHSYDCFPPTWRDLRTFDPYHFECKP